MSTQANPAIAQIEQYVAKGDEYAGKREFSNAYSSYSNAYTSACKVYGSVAPELLPIIEKLVEAAFQNNAAESDTTRKNVGKWLKIALTIIQRQHGVSSPALIPALEKLVVFYDFDGAHMLAIEVLQRIDDIKAANEKAECLIATARRRRNEAHHGSFTAWCALFMPKPA